MRIAMILHGKAHWIFQAPVMPNWPPLPDGSSCVLVDITDRPEVKEGWGYDSETGTFSPPPAPEEDEEEGPAE